jgi:hypothetical protein
MDLDSTKNLDGFEWLFTKVQFMLFSEWFQS